MINPNWPRWIHASLTIHFEDARQTLPFFVEGQTRPTGVTDFAEYRQDGPFFNEININNFYVDVLASIMIQIVPDKDTHKLDRLVGIFLPAFEKAICMYRHGNGPGDDGEQFGTLRLSTNAGERIRVDKFGQTQSATKVAQASIEARYRMILKV
jgi:hypothetical protein